MQVATANADALKQEDISRGTSLYRYVLFCSRLYIFIVAESIIISADLQTFYRYAGGAESELTIPTESALDDASTIGGQSVLGAGLTLFIGRLQMYGGLSSGAINPPTISGE